MKREKNGLKELAQTF